ncbi:hypothetical protein TanjilG_29784 [Lupinus angustifolius]|uniref:LOB domain-containing protein n=1 Tax=Lupinus angustifolius TaxID=3871 RepID=A0A394DCZ2_LUPAN|nr:hypothetical protein TanjilG_29784 [Lupinus angustifolius]
MAPLPSTVFPLPAASPSLLKPHAGKKNLSSFSPILNAYKASSSRGVVARGSSTKSFGFGHGNSVLDPLNERVNDRPIEAGVGYLEDLGGVIQEDLSQNVVCEAPVSDAIRVQDLDNSRVVGLTHQGNVGTSLPVPKSLGVVLKSGVMSLRKSKPKNMGSKVLPEGCSPLGLPCCIPANLEGINSKVFGKSLFEVGSSSKVNDFDCDKEDVLVFGEEVCVTKADASRRGKSKPLFDVHRPLRRQFLGERAKEERGEEERGGEDVVNSHHDSLKVLPLLAPSNSNDIGVIKEGGVSAAMFKEDGVPIPNVLDDITVGGTANDLFSFNDGGPLGPLVPNFNNEECVLVPSILNGVSSLNDDIDLNGLNEELVEFSPHKYVVDKCHVLEEGTPRLAMLDGCSLVDRGVSSPPNGLLSPPLNKDQLLHSGGVPGSSNVLGFLLLDHALSSEAVCSVGVSCDGLNADRAKVNAQHTLLDVQPCSLDVSVNAGTMRLSNGMACGFVKDKKQKLSKKDKKKKSLIEWKNFCIDLGDVLVISNPIQMEQQRSDAVKSMVYEANARVRDPVYGCVGAISSLQQQVDVLQTQLALAQAEVVHMKMHQAITLLDHDQPPVPIASNSSSQTKSFFAMDIVVDQANMGESLWSC